MVKLNDLKSFNNMMNILQSLLIKESQILLKNYVPTKEVILQNENKLEKLDFSIFKNNNKNVISVTESKENSNGIFNNFKKDILWDAKKNEANKKKDINFDFEKTKKGDIENNLNDALIKTDDNSKENIINEQQKEFPKKKIKAKRIKKNNLESNNDETHLNENIIPILNKIEEENSQLEETLNQMQPMEILPLEKTKIKIEEEEESEEKEKLTKTDDASKQNPLESNFSPLDSPESAEKNKNNENVSNQEESIEENDFDPKPKRKRLRLLNNPPPSPPSHRKSERLKKKVTLQDSSKPDPPQKTERKSEKAVLHDISKKRKQNSLPNYPPNKVSINEFFKDKKNFGAKFRKTNCDLFMPHPPSAVPSSSIESLSDSVSEVSSIFKDELIPYTKEFNCSLFEKREFFENKMEDFLMPISEEKEVGGRKNEEEKGERKIRKKNINQGGIGENQGECRKGEIMEKKGCEILIEDEKMEGNEGHMIEINVDEDKGRRPEFEGEDRAFGGVRKREWRSWSGFDKFFESLRLS